MIRIAPFVLVMLVVLVPVPAAAQGLGGFGLPDEIGGLTSANIIQLFGLITVLAIAPGLLIMVTSFTRFIIVFSILRTGLGLQSTPANIILISLALFMTFYVMAPTFDRAWQNGLQPLLNNDIQEEQALSEIVAPFRDFMLENTRDEDLDLFTGLARERGQDVVVNGTIEPIRPSTISIS